MVTEIELKAHIHNSEEMMPVLSEKAEFLYAFIKKDTYWFSGGLELPPSGLRIRSEKRTFPDGREESFTMATYKNKEVRNGIEINDEREFTVEPVSEFEEFLKRMRLKPARSKEKHGWAFSKDGITAELVEVKGLGWFVELEIIAKAGHGSGNNEKTFAEGRKRLLDFLGGLGIAEEAIESRYYTEMLEANG